MPEATWNTGQGPEKVFDGSSDTKYCDTSNQGSFFFFFESPVVIASYSWVTANDATARDVVSWNLKARHGEDTEWDVIGRVQQFPVTTGRKAPVGTFSGTSDRSKPSSTISTIDIASKINHDDKYWGGVLAGNGRVYFAPRNADNIGELDLSTGAFSTINISGTINHDNKYAEGVLAGNGRIYFVPHNADNIGQLDPSTGAFSAMDISGTISHDAKYAGGVLAGNGRLYFVPHNADNIGVLDPSADL